MPFCDVFFFWGGELMERNSFFVNPTSGGTETSIQGISRNTKNCAKEKYAIQNDRMLLIEGVNRLAEVSPGFLSLLPTNGHQSKSNELPAEPHPTHGRLGYHSSYHPNEQPHQRCVPFDGKANASRNSACSFRQEASVLANRELSRRNITGAELPSS